MKICTYKLTHLQLHTTRHSLSQTHTHNTHTHTHSLTVHIDVILAVGGPGHINGHARVPPRVRYPGLSDLQQAPIAEDLSTVAVGDGPAVLQPGDGGAGHALSLTLQRDVGAAGHRQLRWPAASDGRAN